jgi:hypothetical protein
MRKVPWELSGLRRLFDSRDPVPDSVVLAALAAPNTVRGWSGAEQLELVDDSAEAPVSANVRSWPGKSRVLTFAAGTRVIEMDLASTAPGLMRASGMVLNRNDPGVPSGGVVLRHPSGQCGSPLDEHGRFLVDDVPRGPLSVVFRTDRSAPAVADWLIC